MAFDIQGFTRSWTIGATDLSAAATINTVVCPTGYQYMFVRFVGGLLVPVTANSQQAVGILQTYAARPANGQAGTVMISGVTKVRSHDANIVVGSPLYMDNFGMVVTTGGSGAGSVVVGVAEEAAATGTGFLVSMCMKPLGAFV